VLLSEGTPTEEKPKTFGLPYEGSPAKLLSGLRIFRKESTKKHRLRACVRELFGRF
jgi:hypothetical protein